MNAFLTRPLFTGNREARGTLIAQSSTTWDLSLLSRAEARLLSHDALSLLPSWFCIECNGVTFAVVGPCDRDVSWYTTVDGTERIFVPFNGTPSANAQVKDIVAAAKNGATFNVTGRTESGNRLILVEAMRVHRTLAVKGGTGVWFKAPKIGISITLIEKRTT